MREILELTGDQIDQSLDALIDLLQDTVNSGASVGFLPPLERDEAARYWSDVRAAIDSGTRRLLVAREAGRIVGAVQLDLPPKPNARHRAEVQKLVVHTAARRQGLGRALMTAIEALARAHGRTLLVLDTRQGDTAEGLYRSLGYIKAGTIPRYARSADGALHATVFMYRELDG